jgi:ferredoxin
MLARWFHKGAAASPAPTLPHTPAPPASQPAVAAPLKVIVEQDICHHCGGCVAVCPPDAIWLEGGSVLHIDQATCTACERCVTMCPVHALAMAVPQPPR